MQWYPPGEHDHQCNYLKEVFHNCMDLKICLLSPSLPAQDVVSYQSENNNIAATLRGNRRGRRLTCSLGSGALQFPDHLCEDKFGASDRFASTCTLPSNT